MRRSFLKLMALFIAGIFGGRRTAQALEGELASQFDFTDPSTNPRSFKVEWLPIVQGATTASVAQISVLIPNHIPARIEVLTHAGLKLDESQVQVTSMQWPTSDWGAHKVIISGLEPAREYQLRVLAEDGFLLDSRLFSTLRRRPPRRLRVVLASCMRDRLEEKQGVMWEAVAQTNPDLMVFLGDNVYVDDGPGRATDGDRIWRRYVECRLTLDVYRWRRLVPVIATWDDHDYGDNNSGASAPFRDDSTRIFHFMFAQDPVLEAELVKGPGISRMVKVYGHRFFLMDSRSFRVEAENENDGEHWGSEQERWLDEELARDRAPAWLCNGSQYFGGYVWGGGSFEHLPQRFLPRLKQLREAPVSILFASGDMHYSEVMQIEDSVLGYSSYEITSSSLHSRSTFVFPRNRRRLASTARYNFVVADAHLVMNGAGQTPGVLLDVTSIGENNEVHFRLKGLRVQK